MRSIEEFLGIQGKLPEFYRRYELLPELAAATVFLDTLNHAHSAVSFTMEVEENGMLPFPGVQLLNRAPCVETKVYVKPTLGYSRTIIAMWTAATSMVCSSPCLIARTGYLHLGRIS